LQRRDIDVRPNRFFEAAIPNVSHYADNLDKLFRALILRGHIRPEAFADGVGAVKKLFGGGFVDQGHARRADAILRGKDPAAKQRDAERFEIIGRDAVKTDAGLFDIGAAFDVYHGPGVTAQQRGVSAETGGLDSRQRLHARERLFIKLRLRVARIDGHLEQVIRHETQGNRLQAQQTVDHQSRAT
jgi:hypothetical protein